MRPDPRLLADIGGTHLRLAWQPQAGAPARDTRVLACAQFSGVQAAIGHYLKETGAPAPRQAALGIANPVTGDEVRMTNRSWHFSQHQLQQALGLDRLVVINDFTALALALPLIDAALLHQVGGERAAPGAAIGLIGPGTGLGVSGLVPLAGVPGAATHAQSPQGLTDPLPLDSTQAGARVGVIAGEGGHVTLAAETALEFQVIEQLQQRFGHVSAERVLCGSGLLDLYHALRAIQGGTGSTPQDPAEVTSRALGDTDPLAVKTLQMFCGWLGGVAGDLALTLGARGGIYIGGGIVPRLGTWFGQSPFRPRFEAKGRFRDYLAPIPCWVINAQSQPTLLGLARVLDSSPHPFTLHA